MNAIAIGVDFGTSNTVIALLDERSQSRVIPVRTRAGTTSALASVLCFRPHPHSPRERPVTSAGADAIADYIARVGNARLVQSLKSFLGSRSFVDTSVFSHVYTLEDMIATLLSHLYEATAAREAVKACRLVVGRPIEFAGTNPDDSLAQSRLLQAFESAARRPDQIGLEPEAAAYAFASRAKGKHLIMVADLGGGTSDFSIVEVDADCVPPRIEPLAQTGVGIAGDRFDHAIVYNAVCPALGRDSRFRPETKSLPVPLWIYANFSSWHQLSMMNNRQTLRHITDVLRSAEEPRALEGLVHIIRNEEGFSLFQAVARAKQQLTRETVTRLQFKAGPVEVDRSISRAEFETWIHSDLNAITTSADAAMERAGVKPADVTRVFMTGGSSLVPAVRAAFAQRFGTDKLVGGDEFSSVAQGLALMGRR